MFTLEIPDERNFNLFRKVFIPAYQECVLEFNGVAKEIDIFLPLNEENVTRAFRENFVMPEGPIRLEIWKPQFQCHVDVRWDRLPEFHRFRATVIVAGGAQLGALLGPGGEAAAVLPPADRAPDRGGIPAVPGVQVAAVPGVHNPGVLHDVAMNEGTMPLPAHYEVPPLSRDVMADLNSDRSVVLPSTRSAIIGAVYHNIRAITNSRYVSDDDIVRVARAITEKYPKLRDTRLKVTGIDVEYCPYGSIRKMLVEKLKEKRRGINEPEVVRNREAFHRIARRPPPPPPNPIQATRRANANDLDMDEDFAEDQLALETHQRVIQEEWSKERRNLGIIMDRMSRTKIHRRNMMRTEMPSLVVELYPTLRDMRQVIEEGFRQFRIMTSDSRIRWLSNERVKNMCSLLRRSNARSHKSYMWHLNNCADDALAEAERHFALICLPFLARSMRHWVLIDEEIETEFPTLIIRSREGRSIFNESPSMAVYIYKQVVCTAEPEDNISISEGIDALMVLHHLSNINEGPSCPNSWRFASEIIYGFKSLKKITKGMQTLGNAIG